MKRAIIIFSILLCSTISVAETFPSQNVNTNPVGFQSGEDYLLTYPGISDGEKVAMAQNGPFAIVVFTFIISSYVFWSVLPSWSRSLLIFPSIHGFRV